MPTVKMMGTANNTTVGDSSVAFPPEPVKGKSRKRDGYVLPLALNPGTAKKRIELTLRRRGHPIDPRYRGPYKFIKKRLIAA